MKLTKIIVVSLALIIAGATANAQDYKTGLGLRGGYPSGITVKHFFGSKTAVDGILSFGWGGIGITGLYELHNRIPSAPGLNWYYGFGGHFATADASKNNPFANDRGDEVFLGVDGAIGLEFTFPDAPICISLDILPILNLIESPGIWFNAGLSVRYAFK